MNKRLTIFIVGLLFNFLIQSFQQPWEKELRNYFDFLISSDESDLSPTEKDLGMQLKAQNIDLDAVVSKLQDFKKLALDKSNLVVQSLVDDEKIKYRILQKAFEQQCKKLNIEGEVQLVLNDNDIASMAYLAGCRVVTFSRFFLQNVPLDFLLFGLKHELTHVEQHVRDGLINYASRVLVDDTRKMYEIEADQNARSVTCLSCRKDVELCMLKFYEQNQRPDYMYLSKKDFLEDMQKPFDDYGGIYNVNSACSSCRFKHYTK